MNIPRALVILILITVTAKGFTQEKTQSTLSGAITGEFNQTNHSSYGALGLDAWIPIKKKFTLNYSIRMGIPGKGIYVRGSAGLMLGAALMGAAGQEGGITAAIGAICMLLPEGVGVYIGNEKRKLHLAINPLAGEYRFIDTPRSEWSQVSGNLTLRGVLPLNWGNVDFISPYLASYYNYDAQQPLGFRLGLSVGFNSK
jgi:hypothetical protein